MIFVYPLGNYKATFADRNYKALAHYGTKRVPIQECFFSQKNISEENIFVFRVSATSSARGSSLVLTVIKNIAGCPRRMADTSPAG